MKEARTGCGLACPSLYIHPFVWLSDPYLCTSLHTTPSIPAYLQSGEELGVDERRLAVAQAGGHIPGHAEVGVLCRCVRELEDDLTVRCLLSYREMLDQRARACALMPHITQCRMLTLPDIRHTHINILAWSMAQGMRQGMSVAPFKGMGKAAGKEGAACTAGKATLPQESDSVKPKMPRAWLVVVEMFVDDVVIRAVWLLGWWL